MYLEIEIFKALPWVMRIGMFAALLFFLAHSYYHHGRGIGWARLGAIFLIAILVIWVAAVLSDVYARWRLSTFDLDGDGVFSDNDLYTPVRGYFNQFIVDDTGRTFMPFGAIVQSTFLVVVTQILAYSGYLISRLWVKLKRS